MSRRFYESDDSTAALRRGTPLNTLTQSMIVKACVDQGFYRTPACNDKLYLHHRALEAIDPHAFDAYTQVKVLWLEGNLLKRIACGDDVFMTERVSLQPSDACEGASKSATLAKGGVDSHAHSGKDAAVEGTEPADREDDSRMAAAPCNTQVDTDAGVDIFSTMYPTLRQLYLHNNMLAEMPDLGKFDNLDSVNLSNNSIARVRSGCAFWKTFLSTKKDEEAEQEEEDAAQSVAAVESGSKESSCCIDERVERMMVDGSSKSALRGSYCPSNDVARTSASRVKVVESVDESRMDRWVNVCKHEARVPEPDRVPHYQHDSNSLEVLPKGVSQEESSSHHVDPMETVLAEKKVEDAVDHLAQCPCCTLTTLNLAGNSLREVENLAELLCYKRLVSLDLSNNLIADGESLLYLLSKLGEQKSGEEPHLRSVRLSGNPFVRKMANYRKRVLSAIPSLYHLDDRPVFPDERRLVTAWGIGGAAAEQKERELIRAESEQKEKDRLAAFRSLVNQVRQNRQGNNNNNMDVDAVECQSVSVRNPPVGALHALREATEAADDASETDSETSTDASMDSDDEDVRGSQVKPSSDESGKTVQQSSSSMHSKSDDLSLRAASPKRTTESTSIENGDEVWIPE